MKKLPAILGVVIVLGIAAAAASVAVANTGKTVQIASGPSCKTATIGMTGPYTGPAAPLGLDQKHWGELFVNYWDSGKPIPGTPAGFKRTKIKLQEGDETLIPATAATVAVQLRSNAAVLGVVGFSVSQNVVAGGPILRRGGIAMVSGSATRVSLTDPTTPDGHVLSTGYFHRVVPNDGVQAPTDAKWIEKSVTSGQTVMLVDSADAYSVPLIQAIGAELSKAGIKADHESQPQPASGTADYTSLAQKAVAENAKYVVLAVQVPAAAQLFAQQLKADGYTGKFLGTDGTFGSPSQFNVEGSYISYFAPAVTTIKSDASIDADFAKRYGVTLNFGPPTWVAAQVVATAISMACADGHATRAEVRKDIGKVSLKTTLLGRPIAFTPNGDVKGASFPIFQIKGGQYVVVQP